MKKEYSGKKVIKAGDTLIAFEEKNKNDSKFLDAMDVLSYWRFTHIEPLEKAINLLQHISLKKDKNAIFAKRLKRHTSIVKKLLRFQRMKLKNMQDIGGCRVVLTNQKKLKQTVRDIKKHPEFKHHDGSFKAKDYVKNPKDDGYRGFHIIGFFPDSTGKILSIEFQLRTRIQHYWATALEIVDLFTDQALKSNQGEDDWKLFFTEVSEQFSIMDNIHIFDTFSFDKKVDLYEEVLMLQKNDTLLQSCKVAQDLCKKLDVFEKLNAFSASLQIIEDKLSKVDTSAGYILLKINVKKSLVHTKIFSLEDSKIAEQEYIEEEKSAMAKNEIVIALVSTTSVGDIKEAYPNYFADSTKFMDHLNIVSELNIISNAKEPKFNFLPYQ